MIGHNWAEVSELVDAYDPPRPNNMTEIKAEVRENSLSGGRVDDYDAKEELIREAIDRIVSDNHDAVEWNEDFDACRLVDGVDADTLVDFNDRPLIRGPVLPDLFSPETGAWIQNLRSYLPEGLKELRDSMQAVGWLPDLPAIQDEHGVVIVGHRRLDVANELGIEPVIKTVRFGEGQAADAARVALAIASNVGAEKISAADRKKIAADLYGSGWSMAKIGDLLKVATMTVSRDLRGFNTLLNPPDKPKRGRPRKEP